MCGKGNRTTSALYHMLSQKHTWKKAETFFCTLPALWPLIHTPKCSQSCSVYEHNQLIGQLISTRVRGHRQRKKSNHEKMTVQWVSVSLKVKCMRNILEWLMPVASQDRHKMGHLWKLPMSWYYVFTRTKTNSQFHLCPRQWDHHF